MWYNDDFWEVWMSGWIKNWYARFRADRVVRHWCRGLAMAIRQGAFDAAVEEMWRSSSKTADAAWRGQRVTFRYCDGSSWSTYYVVTIGGVNGTELVNGPGGAIRRALRDRRSALWRAERRRNEERARAAQRALADRLN